MKILDLCEFYSERGGGVRSYLTKLTAAAGPRGHEVVIVAPGPHDETIEADGARVLRYAAPRMPYDTTYHWAWRIDRMRALIREEKPQVLQVSSPFVPAAVATTLRDVPVRSYVYHSDPIGCYLEYNARRYLPRRAADLIVAPAWGWMRTVCRSCDVTIVAGHWLAEFLGKRGCEKVVTVPFGISHLDFGPDRRDEGLRRELLGSLAGDPRARLLLIAGRLAVDKRQRLLLAAVRDLARKRPVALTVLGDGPERERMQREAQGMPVARFLNFTHDRARYAAILATADALIHGSRCETYGFVLAEALASGTPIVVPDAGGATAMAPPDCSEKFRPLANPGEIAAAIDRLLDRPPEQLTLAAIAAAAKHPSLEQHFDQLFELYERLVEAKGA
jgi:alpha-1,6-mannosyltransferase